MDNNQNANNSSSFGMLNANPQPSNQSSVDLNASVPNDAAQNNIVTLGEVSNVTYADTLGDLNTPAPQDTAANAPVQTGPDSFINTNYNETSIADLNVEGTYNNMNVAPDYSSDPKVRENLNPDKKNTIVIGKELKTFFIIALVLLVFIIFMPVISELVDKIRFN